MIFEENFIVRGNFSMVNFPRGQLPGGQFSSMAIVRWAIFLEGNFPREQLSWEQSSGVAII